MERELQAEGQECEEMWSQPGMSGVRARGSELQDPRGEATAWNEVSENSRGRESKVTSQRDSEAKLRILCTMESMEVKKKIL